MDEGNPMDLADRHPSTVAVARYFDYQHLAGDLRLFSAECAALADSMLTHLDDSPELTVGLRKLLEAKDCFVRAALDESG
jgi:hypothetical protein